MRADYRGPGRYHEPDQKDSIAIGWKVFCGGPSNMSAETEAVVSAELAAELHYAGACLW
jgi:hypothetical protein